MISVIIFLISVSLADTCNTQCNYFCSIFNAKESCYTHCGCSALAQVSVDDSISLKFKYEIENSYDCLIEDVLSCENSEDYYSCLEEVNCLVVSDGLLLIGSIPPSMWKAAQPKQLSLNLLKENAQSNCEGCLNAYYADEYYACALLHCRQKISENANFLKLNQKEFKNEPISCTDCGGYGMNEEDFINCV